MFILLSNTLAIAMNEFDHKCGHNIITAKVVVTTCRYVTVLKSPRSIFRSVAQFKQLNICRTLSMRITSHPSSENIPLSVSNNQFHPQQSYEEHQLLLHTKYELQIVYKFLIRYLWNILWVHNTLKCQGKVNHVSINVISKTLQCS